MTCQTRCPGCSHYTREHTALGCWWRTTCACLRPWGTQPAPVGSQP